MSTPHLSATPHIQPARLPARDPATGQPGFETPPGVYWRRLLLIVANVVLLAALLPGCDNKSGRLTLYPDGRMEVRQPPKAMTPAWLKLSLLGATPTTPSPGRTGSDTASQTQPSFVVEMSTGMSYPPPQVDPRAGTWSAVIWLGVACMVLGAASLIISLIPSVWPPLVLIKALIPRTGSLALIGIGLMLVTLPDLVERLWWLPWTLAACAAGLYLIGLLHNRKLINTPPPTPEPQPDPETT